MTSASLTGHSIASPNAAAPCSFIDGGRACALPGILPSSGSCASISTSVPLSTALSWLRPRLSRGRNPEAPRTTAGKAAPSRAKLGRELPPRRSMPSFCLDIRDAMELLSVGGGAHRPGMLSVAVEGE